MFWIYILIRDLRPARNAFWRHKQTCLSLFSYLKVVVFLHSKKNEV